MARKIDPPPGPREPSHSGGYAFVRPNKRKAKKGTTYQADRLIGDETHQPRPLRKRGVRYYLGYLLLILALAALVIVPQLFK